MDLIAIAGCPLELVEHPAFVNTIKHLDSGKEVGEGSVKGE